MPNLAVSLFEFLLNRSKLLRAASVLKFVSFVHITLFRFLTDCFTLYHRRPRLGGRGGGIQDIRKCMGICNDSEKS